MSRATLQDQAFLGHQGGYPTIMRQHPDQGAGGDRRPSRLLQMREDYQRRLMKEKEERMVHTFEDHKRKNLERVDRVAKVPAVNEEYPNSRLRQPGYMQTQIPPPGQASSEPSVRDFFRERKDMDSKGKYMPPINQHFKDNKSRIGSGGRTYQKNSAGVDRANPLAPIQPRHGGISSAPAQPPNARTKHHAVKQSPASPDFDVHGHVKPSQRSPPARKPTTVRGKPSPKAEKLSDFQKWQMEQNKAREDRLKKLNMRAPPSERESRDWGGDYEYEDEEVEDYDRSAREAERAMNEEVERREQELLQRIAHQQSELDRLKREREEEEELERQEAEILRKQQAADREMRRQRQQEEARRRREEEAQARQEEEKQRMAARARQERQHFEARLDLYGDAIHDDSKYPSQPNSHRGNPFQPSSHRRNSFKPSAHDDDPFQPGSYRDNPSSQQEYPFQPSSDRRSSKGYHGDSNGSMQTTPRIAPKPPSQAMPRRQPQTHHQRAPQRKPAPPVEDYDELHVPGPGVEVYAQAVDEEQGVKVRLVSCKVCGRNFADDRVQKHQSACKNAHKKREAFDPTQMRTGGTEMAKYVRKGDHKKEHRPKKKADWRQQHQEFIANIRYAKQVQQMEQQGVPVKDLPPPPPSKANLDLVPCPNCGRTFNEHAAERHIPRCQELKTRPVANNRQRR